MSEAELLTVSEITDSRDGSQPPLHRTSGG